MKDENTVPFQRLVEIVARLRAPDGCPWDREQTPQSAAPYLIEEAHEAAEAIDSGDPTAMREELGDLLLQVVFQTQMVADTSGAFTLSEVIRGITEKLIRRHPHVFADTKVADTAEVLENWEKIKRTEKPGKQSMLEGLPATLPALLKAYRLGQKAARVGFDWSSIDDVLKKMDEELRELHASRGTLRLGSGQAQDAAHLNMEYGDLLLAVANLGRFLDIDPEGALRRANERFVRRFQWIETAAVTQGKPLHTLTPAEWDTLWTEAKQWTAGA